MDKAGKSYWDSLWARETMPRPVNPRDRSLRNEVNLRFHEWFASIFAGASGQRLLETGCANSKWLPYFSREFGMNVTGIDYSEIGCASERAILDAAQVPGEVVCADFFSPPDRLLGSFDFVVSLGVAEHFEDTSLCIGAFARFLRPGGELITVVPNLTGSVGLVQKRLNRPVFDVHVPLTDGALAEAHAKAGLEVLEARYFLSTNFGVPNLVGLRPGVSTFAKGVFLKALVGASAATWLFERLAFRVPARRALAPYVVCRARKPI